MEDFSLNVLPWLSKPLVILFFVAVCAGFIDTLAGGGGLITIPALLLSGMPPLAALATNKLQGSMGTATATFMILKNKKVKWGDVKFLMLTAFVGAALGTFAVQFINTSMLSFVIPCVLFFIILYFLIAPKFSISEGKERVSPSTYRNLVVPGIGGYDGMFGPGTGSFFALAGVSCQGKDLIASTAMAKPLNFATNIASLLVFVLAGQVVWLTGILMMLGQVIGAWLGVRCLFIIKTSVLRALVILMSTAMLIKYTHSLGWW